MNVIAEIQRINERELEKEIPFHASWHQKYRHSAWVYIGGFPYELTEGDIICVMSQFGEVEDINLVRDQDTGKSKGFAFLKYDNQLSTVLAVDNFNGAKLLNRTVRVDHVEKYKLPKQCRQDSSSSSDSLEDSEDSDRERKVSSQPKPRGLPGHAYEAQELANDMSIHKGQDVFAPVPENKEERKKRKKEEKKQKKEVRKKLKREKKLQNREHERQIEKSPLSSSKRGEIAPPNGNAAISSSDRSEKVLSTDGWNGRLGLQTTPRGEFVPEIPQRSSTGWRGRLEPNVQQQQRLLSTKKLSATASTAFDQNGRKMEVRETKENESYGGLGRRR